MMDLLRRLVEEYDETVESYVDFVHGETGAFGWPKTPVLDEARALVSKR